jgi:hypothetical protein
MSAGLPIKFYTLDDSVMFYLRRVRKCKSVTFKEIASKKIVTENIKNTDDSLLVTKCYEEDIGHKDMRN